MTLCQPFLAVSPPEYISFLDDTRTLSYCRTLENMNFSVDASVRAETRIALTELA